MKISTTYTVGGETFATEQEALDYSYFLERKSKVSALMETLFKQTHLSDIDAAYHYSNIDQLCEGIVKRPEIFRQALDIVEGK